jgi:hypothetical protein
MLDSGQPTLIGRVDKVGMDPHVSTYLFLVNSLGLAVALEAIEESERSPFCLIRVATPHSIRTLKRGRYAMTLTGGKQYLRKIRDCHFEYTLSLRVSRCGFVRPLYGRTIDIYSRTFSFMKNRIYKLLPKKYKNFIEKY